MKVRTAQGIVDLPASQAIDLARRGQAQVQADASVPVVDANGNHVYVDAKDIESALGSGYQISDDESQHAQLAQEEQYGTVPQQILTGAEGTLRGLTLGISDVALASDEQTKHEMLAREQTNPGVAISSEIAGAALPVILSGGSGAAAEGAQGASAIGRAGALLKGTIKTVGAPARAADAFGQIVGRGIEKVAGEGLAGRIAAGAGRAMAEQVPQSIGHELSQNYLANKESTFDGVAAAVGRDVLMAGALGGALPLAGAGISHVGSRVGKKAAGAAGRGKSMIMDVIGSADESAAKLGGMSPERMEELSSLISTASGADEKIVRKFLFGDGFEGFRSAEAQRMRKIATSDIGDDLDHATRSFSQDADELAKAIEDTGEEFKGLAKGRRIEKIIKEENLDPTAIKDAADMSLAAAYDKLRVVRSAIEEEGIRPSWLKSIKAMERQTEDAMSRITALKSTAKDAASAYQLVDDLKRSMQRTEKAWQSALMRSSDVTMQRHGRQVAEALESYQELLRQHLESEDVWGLIGRAQRQNNAAWRAAIGSAGNVEKHSRIFTKESATEIGEYFDKHRADPSAIMGFLKRTGTAENSLAEEHVWNWIESAENFSRSLADNSMGSERLIRRADRVAKLAAKMRATMENIDNKIAVKNAFERLKQQEANGLNVGSILSGGTAGGLIGGIPGAAIGAAGSLATTALTRPAALISRVAQVEKIGSHVKERVAKAANKYVGDMVERGTRSGAVVRSSAGRAYDATSIAARNMIDRSRTVARRGRPVVVEHFTDDDADREYRKSRKMIERAARDPESIAANVRDATAGLPPAHAQAVQARAAKQLQFIADNMPKASRQTISGQAQPPSKEQLREFATKMRAMKNPQVLMDDLRSGTLSKGTVDTVRQLYPDLYAHMRQQMVFALRSMKTPPPYEDRIAINMAFGITSDPTMTPQFTQQMQALYANKSGDKSSAAQRKPPPPTVQQQRTRALMTPSQRTEIS